MNPEREICYRYTIKIMKKAKIPRERKRVPDRNDHLEHDANFR